MLRVTSIFILGLTAAALTACHTTSGDIDSFEMNTKSPDRVMMDDVMVREDTGEVWPAPVYMDAPDQGMMGVTRVLSGGGVELFPLDGPVAPSFPAFPDGVQATSESSVTVFPVDGGEAFPAPFSNLQAPMQQDSMARSGTARVYFKHGSARLGSNDRKTIQEAAEVAKFSPVNRVTVEGHASSRAGSGDPVKDSVLNLKESMNRAFAVSKEMLMSGVPAEKIRTTAWGASKPPATVQGNAEAEAEARRVEIFAKGGGTNF